MLYSHAPFSSPVCRFVDVFNIYTREAGAGELSVAVEGPSDALIKLEERPHGFLGVSYKVKVAGKAFYQISVSKE